MLYDYTIGRLYRMGTGASSASVEASGIETAPMNPQMHHVTGGPTREGDRASLRPLQPLRPRDPSGTEA